MWLRSEKSWGFGRYCILGPLSNPAGANMELMGVFDQSLVEPLAQVMANLRRDTRNGRIRTGSSG